MRKRRPGPEVKPRKWPVAVWNPRGGSNCCAHKSSSLNDGSEGHELWNCSDASTFFFQSVRDNPVAYTEVLNAVKPWITAVVRGRPYVFQQDTALSIQSKKMDDRKFWWSCHFQLMAFHLSRCWPNGIRMRRDCERLQKASTQNRWVSQGTLWLQWSTFPTSMERYHWMTCTEC